MLAMSSVVVDYAFNKSVFLTFYIVQVMMMMMMKDESTLAWR